MKNNSSRFDLSNRLIHFFRELDLESSSAPPTPEHWEFGNICEDTKISPLFLLRCAVRQCRLWATWSYRNGRRTIYGPNPAVCFTEMPLAAFIDAAESRTRRGEAISTYALTFSKAALYKRGANPVIYGLSDRQASIPDGKNGSKRIISEDLLPKSEQYRYVTYNPVSPNSIDWTHEREWRWAYRGNLDDFEREIEKFGIIDEWEKIPGLTLIGDDLKGMGVIVKTEEEARRLSYDILTLIDRKVIQRNQYGHILIVDRLPDLKALQEPDITKKAFHDAAIDLADYFDVDQTDAIEERFSKIVKSIENSYNDIKRGEIGGCWLWLLDNTHKLTRALIASERITVSKSGRYLVEISEFSDMRSLAQREEMTKILAKRISKEFDIECGYFSVLNSDNPNGLPFYNSDRLDNMMFYNKSGS